MKAKLRTTFLTSDFPLFSKTAGFVVTPPTIVLVWQTEFDCIDRVESAGRLSSQSLWLISLGASQQLIETIVQLCKMAVKPEFAKKVTMARMRPRDRI